MKSKKTGSMFLSIALTGVCALSGSAVWAKENALMFHGQLVNAGCDAKVMAGTGHPPGSRALKVSEHLSIGIMNRDDACEGLTLPVSTAYAEPTSINAAVRGGIVTLTYQ